MGVGKYKDISSISLAVNAARLIRRIVLVSRMCSSNSILALNRLIDPVPVPQVYCRKRHPVDLVIGQDDQPVELPVL